MNEITTPLYVNASALEVEEALEALPTVETLRFRESYLSMNLVTVANTTYLFRWTAIEASWKDRIIECLDRPSYNASKTTLLGTDAEADVAEVEEGYGPVVFVEVSNDGQHFTGDRLAITITGLLVLGTVIQTLDLWRRHDDHHDIAATDLLQNTRRSPSMKMLRTCSSLTPKSSRIFSAALMVRSASPP